MGMSATHLSAFVRDQDVLGELLHSLSQPLTSLRCSLELSLDEAAERQQAAVGVALQQTERVIGMIQLMREYLDAEQPGTETRRVSLDRVLREVVVDLGSVAEVQGVDLGVEGTCSATVSLPEPRLRLALQYLTLALIEVMYAGGQVVFRLREGSTESALQAKVQQRLGRTDVPASQPGANSIQGTLRMVRMAIAERILETAGTLLIIEEGENPGFLLRIPRMLAASRAVV
jgi:signal transduction histidine kinase